MKHCEAHSKIMFVRKKSGTKNCESKCFTQNFSESTSTRKQQQACTSLFSCADKARLALSVVLVRVGLSLTVLPPVRFAHCLHCERSMALWASSELQLENYQNLGVMVSILFQDC